jgi:hypothetical protein
MTLNAQQTAAGGDRSLRGYARRLKRHPAFRLWKTPLDLATNSLPSACRMATQRFRHLPTAIIVGAQKAGTTQLFAHLLHHPRVFIGAKKEVDYFSKHPERSIAWYRSRFPLRRRVAARAGHVLEASPSYLPMPQALRQMHSVVPDARIIVLLRDPVARAFSHFQHRKTRHLEARTFEQAVDDELRRPVCPPQLGAALRYDAPPMLDYVARGYYALQLEVLFQLYRRDRVLVIDSHDLFCDTAAACRRVFAFLGLEPFDVRASKIYNRGRYDEKIEPRLADRLRRHYETYDDLLVGLLGARFHWMTESRIAAA